MMKKRVLITGAGGFVGRNIVAALLEADFHVTAVDRAFDADLEAAWTGQVNMITTSTESLPDLPVDYLIHGAAITASPEERNELPEDNLLANLLPAVDLLKQYPNIKRGIFISSTAVFSKTEPGVITEEHPTSPMGMYGIAKRTTEMLAHNLREQYARDLIAIRLGNVYGPGERIRSTRPRLSLVGQMIDEALNTSQITLQYPDEQRDWTYAPDIGRTIVALLNQPVLHHALYHVISDQMISEQEIANTIQKMLPDTGIAIGEATRPPMTRLGTYSNKRLVDDTGFNSWTPFEHGVSQIIRQRIPEA